MINRAETRILLVDDDQNMLTSLCDILEFKGYQTYRANRGEPALKIIEDQEVDVALVDLRLEDISGLDLIRRIKQRSPFSECILLTGYATQSSAIEAVAAGVFGYFLKPFEIDQVILSIQQAAQKSKASKALEANERRMRRLIENGRDNIVVISADGIVKWTNPFVESMWGLNELEQDLKKSTLLHPDEEGTLFSKFDHVVSTPGGKENLTFRLRNVSGEWRWVEATAVNLLDDLAINGVVVNFRDITEQKLAEENLAKSESRYRNLFEDSPIAIKEEDFSEVKKMLDLLKKEGIKNWSTYFNNHPEFVKECARLTLVTDVNRSTVKLLGAKDKRELMGSLASTLTEESYLSFTNELIIIATEKTTFSSESVSKPIDGLPIDVSVFWKVVPGYEKDLSKVIVTIIDISDRKEHEKAIEQNNRELALLYSAGRVLSQTLELQNIYQSFFELVSSIMRCDTMYISEFDAESELISARFALTDGKVVDVSKFPSIPLEPEGHGVQSPVIRTGKSFMTNDYWTALEKTKTNYFINEVGEVVPEKQVPPDAPYTQSALIIPIFLHDKVKGTVQIQSTEKNTYNENDLHIAESLVAQIAVAITNASLYQERVEELTARIKAEGELRSINLLQEKIVALGRDLASTLDLTTIYKMAERHLKTMIKCPNYAIILFDDARKEMFPAFVTSDQKEIDTSLLPPLKYDPANISDGRAKAISTRGIVIVNDMESKRKTRGGILVGSEEEPQSAIYIPMVAEDKVLGLLDLQSYENNAFSAADGEWLSVVANQIGLALQNAHLQNDILHDLEEKEKAEIEIRQSFIELEMIYENALIVNQLFDADQIGQKIIEMMSKRFTLHHAVLRLRQIESDKLRVVSYYVPNLSEDRKPAIEKKFNKAVGKIGEGLSGWVIKTGETLRIADVQKDSRYIDTYPGIQSGLYVPIKIGQFAIGSIALESEKPDAFSERDERLLGTIANQAAIAFDNASLYQTIQKELEARNVTEVALRESQGRLQSVLDNTSALVYIKDLEGRYLLVNKAMSKVFHQPINEIIGKKPAEVIDFPEANQHKENDQLVLEKRMPITFEEQHTIKNAKLTYLSVKFPIWNDGGEIIALCGISTDITSQKAKEDELRLLSYAVEQSPAIVILTDTEGNIEYINKKFIEATGYQLEEVVGKTPRILKSGYTSLEEYQYMWQTIKRGEEWRGEFKNRRKDGSLYWESASISPMFDNDGEITHFLGVKEDITSRKEAEFELVRLNQGLEDRVNLRTVELNEANRALEKASKLKDEFLASMSHELRTPLTGVLGLSEALQRGVYGNLNEKQVSILHTIEEGGKHLLNLINDILDLSKIEAGKMELDSSLLSVDEICQASIRMVKEIAITRHQKLTLTQNPIDMLFYADAKRMKQILVNLLGNAVKFTPENGEIGIDVVGDLGKDELTFSVWDTGIGIAKEDMEKLFKPFVQIDSSLSRNYAGTGLGLSLVERLVTLHDGTVKINSEVGKGSRFTMTIPWYREKTDVVNPQVSERNAINSVGQGTQTSGEGLGTILIVEDNEVSSTMLSDFLTFKGFKTTVANSGQLALEIIHSLKPDVVLMDIQMPGIDGLQVIRTIRQTHDEISGVGIIALTALAMTEDRQRCLDAGADDYLVKPVDLDGLVAAIKRLKVKNK